nr:hypothetical protein [Bradyrhizobium sp. 179]
MVPRHDVIYDMARALRDGFKLPQITVFAVGAAFYVIDGHHRLAAYDTASVQNSSQSVHGDTGGGRTLCPAEQLS